MGRRIRGLLPISTELLLPSDLTTDIVQGAIAAKRTRAKQHYDITASNPLPSLNIGDFVYAKPSPHHKSGPWLYGLVTAIPAPRSYIVETPAGLTRRNRAHLRPAAPPPPGALVPRSWLDKLPPSPTPAAESPPCQPPVSHITQPAHPPPLSPTMQPPTSSAMPVPTAEVEAPDHPIPIPLAPITDEPSLCHRPSPIAEESHTNKPVTKTRSGRVCKPPIRLNL